MKTAHVDGTKFTIAYAVGLVETMGGAHVDHVRAYSSGAKVTLRDIPADADQSSFDHYLNQLFKRLDLPVAPVHRNGCEITLNLDQLEHVWRAHSERYAEFVEACSDIESEYPCVNLSRDEHHQRWQWKWGLDLDEYGISAGVREVLDEQERKHLQQLIKVMADEELTHVTRQDPLIKEDRGDIRFLFKEADIAAAQNLRRGLNVLKDCAAAHSVANATEAHYASVRPLKKRGAKPQVCVNVDIESLKIMLRAMDIAPDQCREALEALDTPMQAHATRGGATEQGRA